MHNKYIVYVTPLIYTKECVEFKLSLLFFVTRKPSGLFNNAATFDSKRGELTYDTTVQRNRVIKSETF